MPSDFSVSLEIKRKKIVFDHPLVMAVINLTPDSFFDGGNLYGYKSLDYLYSIVAQYVKHGVDVIDIGAESTRPGAMPVSAVEQLQRIGDSILEIKKRFDILVSVDTSETEVIEHAAQSGADIINDIRALQQPGALDALATSQMAIILMHMRGKPQTMQQNLTKMNDTVGEVTQFLEERVKVCLSKAINSGRIILDPGFGFGKTVEQNLQLLAELREFTQINGYNFPLLAGLSRKSLIGAITNEPIEERLAGSLALAMLALENGVKVLRVHDVKETVAVVKIWQAVKGVVV